MTIEELFVNREISVRCYNICRYANIYTVDELISFYQRNKTFLELKYCGKKSEEELLSICQAYQINDEYLSQDDEKAFSYIASQLNENQKDEINNFILAQSNELSVEIKNKLAHLLDNDFNVENFAEKILSLEAGGLTKVMNLRTAFTWELHTYMESIKELMIDKLREQKFLMNNSDDLDPDNLVFLSKQKNVINRYIYLTSAKLSTRTTNVLYMYLNGDLSIGNFEEKLLSIKDWSSVKIKNAGKTTLHELEYYVYEIKYFVEEVIKTTNEKELLNIRNEYLLKEEFGVWDIPTKIVRSNSIFMLTNFLLDKNSLFNRIHTEIVKKSFKINRNQQTFTTVELALQVNLSTQSIKQIKETALSNFSKKLEFLKNFDDDLFEKYAINVDSPIINITSEQVDAINSTNNTDFTREFIIFILSIYLSDKFSLVGNESDVLLHKVSTRKKRYYWKNIYLINKEVNQNANFSHFVKDIARRLNAYTEKSYSLKFKDYFSKFLFSNNQKYFELALPVAKIILKEEFGMELNQEGEIFFKSNSYKQEFEYAYEALEQLNKPSSVTVIFEKIKELYPDLQTDTKRLKETMRIENGFTAVGAHENLFGLTVWEEHDESFKDASIREIAEQFLHQFDAPQHISDIAEHILLHKPNVKKEYLITNLRQDKMRKFVFFKDSRVGLSSQNYNELLENKK